MFSNNSRLFELLISACSAVEEEQWTKHLTEFIRNKGTYNHEPYNNNSELQSSIGLDLKPLQTMYTQAQGLARRISIRRAATMGPGSQMTQVVVRNTHSGDLMPFGSSTASLPIARSPSLLSGKHIAVLTPRRYERIQLELALGDVWTKDVIPYPGMKSQRSENPFRASASSVMRKFSMVSISSTFSRRSFSASSNHVQSVERQIGPSQHDDRAFNAQIRTIRSELNLKRSGTTVSQRNERPLPVVNFHKTPEIFLPPDFELPNFKGARLPLPSTKPTVHYNNPIQRPKSTSPRKKQSTNKLRRSKSLQRSMSEAPTSSLSQWYMHRYHAEPNIPNTGYRKENMPVVMRPSMTLSKQIRRFFP